MKSIRICISVVTLVLSIAASAMAQSPSVPPVPPAPVQPASAPDPGWEVEIAPIYVWAPISINSLKLPEFPGLPSPPGGGRPSAETGSSLNGAAMAAFRVEKDWWVLRGNFVWAGLTGEVERPYARVSGNVILGELQTGIEVVKHLYIEGGVRRLALDIEAEVLEYPKVSRKPGVWIPIRGADVPCPAGEPLAADGPRRRWRVRRGIRGGPGDESHTRLAGHTPLRPGVRYGLLYFRVKDSLIEGATVDDTLELGTTLHGPILGFKLLF